MAIGTKETQVLEPVVSVVPIYVVELQRDWQVLPHGEHASSATGLKDAFSEKPSLELV